MGQEMNIGKEALELAKSIAKAEKELSLERYVRMIFYRRTEEGESVEIFRYEIPSSFIERWSWVIQWRRAKLICKYPRGRVYETISYYYLKEGKDWGFSEDLSKLVALKGKITLQKNAIKKYLKEQKGSLFFDEANDIQLVKIKKKLARAEANVAENEKRLAEKIKQYKKEGQKQHFGKGLHD